MNKNNIIKIAGYILIIIGIIFYFKLSMKTMSDFKVYYKSAQRIIEKQNLYQTEDDFYMYKYPPFFAFSIAPISYFSIDTARGIWFFYMLICLIGTIIISKKLVGINTISYFFIFLFILKFILQEFHLGQVNLITFFYTLLGIYIIFMLPEYEWTGGIFLAYAIVVKITPMIFIPYLLFRKKFYGLISTILLSILFFFLPVLNYGWNNFSDMFFKWREVVGNYYYFQIYHPSNQSIFGILYRFLTQNDIINNSFNLEKSLVSLIIVFIISILYLILIFPIIFDWKKKQIQDYLTFDINALALLFIYMTFFSPHGFMQNFLTAIPAYMFLYKEFFIQDFNFPKNKSDIFIWKCQEYPAVYCRDELAQNKKIKYPYQRQKIPCGSATGFFIYFSILFLFLFTVLLNYETVGRKIDTLLLSYSSIGLSIFLIIISLNIILYKNMFKKNKI